MKSWPGWAPTSWVSVFRVLAESWLPSPAPSSTPTLEMVVAPTVAVEAASAGASQGDCPTIASMTPIGLLPAWRTS